jgi:hypothetical protein
MVGPLDAKPQVLPDVSVAPLWEESRVKGLPQSGQTSSLWTDYLQRIAPKLPYSGTAEEILQGFVNIDMTAEKFGQILRSNRYYEGQLGRLLDGMAKREVTPSLEASVVLIGIANARNFVLSILLQRSVQGIHPDWTAEGKLKVQPSEILKASLKVEELLVEKKDPYSDLGFAAGLVWDTLAYAVQQDFPPDIRKKAQAWIDSQWEPAVQTGLLAQELVRGVGECSLSKYAFVSAILLPLGKSVAAYLDPKFLPFQDLLVKKNVPSGLRAQLEQRAFGMDFCTFSAAIAENYPWFRPSLNALALYSSPWIAEKADPKGAWPLIGALRLASAMLADPVAIEKPDDPRIQLWKGGLLKNLKVDPAVIVKASQRFKASRN